MTIDILAAPPALYRNAELGPCEQKSVIINTTVVSKFEGKTSVKLNQVATSNDLSLAQIL